MRGPQFTREQIKQQLWRCVPHPLKVDFQSLTLAFGFVRMDGQELAFRQLITGRSEESLQTASSVKTHQNIAEWCRENDILCDYDYANDVYTFSYFLNPKG